MQLIAQYMKPWYGMHEDCWINNISITLITRKPLMHAKCHHSNIIEYPLVNLKRISSIAILYIYHTLQNVARTKLLQLITL